MDSEEYDQTVQMNSSVHVFKGTFSNVVLHMLYLIKRVKVKVTKIYYSKFAKDHFFDVRYFVHIITIYNQIATKGKSMFGPHKRVMQLLI